MYPYSGIENEQQIPRRRW